MTATPVVEFDNSHTRSEAHNHTNGGVHTNGGARSLTSRKSVTATDGPPIITFGTTSSYTLMYNDQGSGAHMDGAFYRPTAPSGYYILGDYAQGNYQPPALPSLTIKVTNDDPSNPVLAAPVGYA